MGDLRSFLQRAKQSRYTIPDTRAGADSPNGSIRPFRPTRRSALGLFHPDRRLSGSGPFRHARHDLHPAHPENPPRPENPPARKIRRPGTSFAREIRLNREIHRPDPHSTRHPSCPALSRSALLHRHVSRPFPPAATRAAHRPSRRMACPMSRGGAAPVQICRPDRMPRQKERQPAGAAALRQSDSGPIICC